MLVATRNPLNIGAVARAMSNFGFFRLCLVNPYEPSFLEARSAVGAAELLANAKVFATVGKLSLIARSWWARRRSAVAKFVSH